MQDVVRSARHCIEQEVYHWNLIYSEVLVVVVVETQDWIRVQVSSCIGDLETSELQVTFQTENPQRVSRRRGCFVGESRVVGQVHPL